MRDQTELLRMEGVRKRFGATIALDGVDLFVRAGEVLALVGENGAGKSTLMKTLSGAHSPDEGRMWLSGQPYQPKHPHGARNAGVSMIYQELSLARHLTVMENIVLGMEPTAGPFVKWKEFRKQAQEEVRALCDRFTVLRDGKSVGSGMVADTPNEQIIAMMVGRSVEDLYPRSNRTVGDAVLELKELAGVKKPASASLTLHRGEVLGIAGLVGTGRTELLRAIFGLDPVRSGRLRLKTYVGAASHAKQWARGMGMVSEDRKLEGLALSLSIADNLTLSSLSQVVRPSAQAEAWGLAILEARFRQRRGMWPPSAQAEASQRWIKRLAIRCREPQQPVANLSGGNQQKVAISRLLEHGTDVLLLDEPTRGIDVGSKAQIYHVIDELACEGKAVLIVSSYLPELLGICDRIAVMAKGYLNPARPVSQITEHDIMIEATSIKEAA